MTDIDKLERLLHFLDNAEDVVRTTLLPGDPAIATAYADGALTVLTMVKNYATTLQKIT